MVTVMSAAHAGSTRVRVMIRKTDAIRYRAARRARPHGASRTVESPYMNQASTFREFTVQCHLLHS